MTYYLKRCKITLTALSPVHIGGGVKIGKKEYIYDRSENNIYFPDMPKMVSALKKRGLLDAYERFLLSPGKDDLYRFLGDNRVDYKPWRGLPLNVKGVADKEIYYNGINAHIKDPYGLPYVPGSSVKGCLRNIVLCDLTKRHNTAVARYKPSPGNIRRNPPEARMIENELLYKLNRSGKNNGDATDDIFAAYRFGDSDPIPRENLIICRKIDTPAKKSRFDDPSAIPTFRECIKPGTKITLPLTVDTKLLGENKPFDFPVLIKKWNAAYRDGYLTHFNAPPPYLDNVIYLGGGCGFHTKTMLLGLMENSERLAYTAALMQFFFRKHGHDKDVNLGVSPHTLKITKYAGKEYEMGRCAFAIEVIE